MHHVISTFRFLTAIDKEWFVDFLRSQEGLGTTRTFLGCLSAGMMTDLSDPNRTVTVWQQWATREDHEAYFAHRKQSGVIGEIMARVGEDLDIRHYCNIQG